jgi:hypothetical protein
MIQIVGMGFGRRTDDGRLRTEGGGKQKTEDRSLMTEVGEQKKKTWRQIDRIL